MNMKRLLICITLFFSVLAFCPALVSANAVLYEMKDETLITKGVVYQRIRQVTEAGQRDIYVLAVDVTDPYIRLAPVESQKEYSLKEPLTSMLSDTDAIAGINGDFFGMAGTRSASFGPVIRNGEFVSVNSALNAGGWDYASFFIDNDNNPFITFIKANVAFYNNGVSNMYVHSVNKITDMSAPVVVTTAAMASTASLDARFSGLYKIVVRNDVITKISAKGESVAVPHDGFVIVMDSKTADNNLFKYKVGERGVLQVSSQVDFDNIKTAIGGGGRLLANGEISNIGFVPTGRHPRTAIGISKDQKTVYLVAVDGRSHSIGANRTELSQIMLGIGAYNAMNLDGGGSTTMAVQLPGRTSPVVVNKVSDGSQRRIINGLGVYNNAPYGDVRRLIAAVGDKNIVYKGTGTVIDVYGADAYYRRYPVNMDEVSLFVSDGFFTAGLYYPVTNGEIVLTAIHDDLTTQTILHCRELRELRPDKTKIRAMEGDAVPLSFTGIDHTGEEALITAPMTYTVVPASAGVVENGWFYPKTNEDGYIEAKLGDITCYIAFQTGGDLVNIESFNSGRDIRFLASNDSVIGSVSYVNKPVLDGEWSAKLSCALPPLDDTQAAYMVLGDGIKIEGAPMAIRLSVYGDMSGLWLRGRVKDKNGESHLIDFAGEVNWNGWKTVNAILPADIEYPVTLDRIYVAATQTEEPIESELFFSGIWALYARPDINILLPDAPKFRDPLMVELSPVTAEGVYDITVLGRTSPYGELPPTYGLRINQITGIITANTRRTLYLGASQMSLDIGVPIYKWNENYVHHYDENVTILQLSARAGGLTGTNPQQWSRFMSDIKGTGKKNVIIMLDKSPLNFDPEAESVFFTDALAALSKDGYNIFVISADGVHTTSTLIGGVRYINLGELWTKDGELNEEFRILRFRVSRNEMRFELRPLE